MSYPYDTGINSIGGKYEDTHYSLSSDDPHWKFVAAKLNREYPDDVIIRQTPEENDGCVVALVPKKWVKITPPRKLNLTDEQKKEMAERLRKADALSAQVRWENRDQTGGSDGSDE